MINFEQINQTALDRLPDLLPELLPEGRFHGREFRCGDLIGNPGQSLSVNTDTGVWSDFATGDKGGDPVSLVAAVRGVSQVEAARWLGRTETTRTTPRPRPKRNPETWKTVPADTLPKSIHHDKHGRPSATWEYRGPAGELLGFACRFDPVGQKKEVLPYTYGMDSTTGETGWKWKAFSAPRPLYGLDRLALRPEAPALIVEGEKTADAAQRLLPAVVAITWPGGCNATAMADFSPLKGCRVALWPDNDDSGRKAAEAVSRAALEAGAVEVSIIEVPPDKAKGWDLADAEAEGWTPKQVAGWIKGHKRPVDYPSGQAKGANGAKSQAGQGNAQGLNRGEKGLKLDESQLVEMLRRAREKFKPVAGAAPAYPVDALGLLADACKTVTSEGQVAPEMAGQCLLATAALLVQSVANVRTLAGIKPLSLFGLTVAESGDGKSTAEEAALRAIRARQRDDGRKYRQLVEELQQTKKKKDDPAPPMPCEPYRVMKDGTVEGIRRSFKEGLPSQGCFTSEAAVMLGGYGMSAEHRGKSAGNLNGLWDDGEMSVARGTEGRLQLYDRRLSIHWLVQPDVAYQAVHDPMLSSIGFWPRFLLACPPPSPPLKARRFEPEQFLAIREYWDRCEELLDQALGEDCSGVQVIPPTAEAEKMACRFYEKMQIEAKTEGGGLTMVKPFAVRATEQAFRVAGVLAAFSRYQEIDVEAMKNGITLAAYSLDSWRAVFGDQDDNAARSWALSLYEWLLRQPGQQATESAMLQIGPKSLRSKHRRDTALALLQQEGMAGNDRAMWCATAEGVR